MNTQSTNDEARQDLVIIGAGVMGLMTAYYAAPFARNITIIERHSIGHLLASSTGETRSIRNDYLDPFYARLAHEARTLWDALQRTTDEQLIVETGCLNIAKSAITPNLNKTYAALAHKNIADLGFACREFDRAALQATYPQFDADYASLDIHAGMTALPAIRRTLLAHARANSVQILENTEVQRIIEGADGVTIETATSTIYARKAVLSPGRWINELLPTINGIGNYRLPLTMVKPDWAYFVPPTGQAHLYNADTLPVFAYLDVGAYGHPIYVGHMPGVKVGFYHPADFDPVKSVIQRPEDFIRECLPGFTQIERIDDPMMEGCSYDMVSDDHFIIGALPGYQHLILGSGWRGTGYKFAPLCGKILAQLALHHGSIYDIRQFDPARFVG